MFTSPNLLSDFSNDEISYRIHKHNIGANKTSDNAAAWSFASDIIVDDYENSSKPTCGFADLE